MHLPGMTDGDEGCGLGLSSGPLWLPRCGLIGYCQPRHAGRPLGQRSVRIRAGGSFGPPGSIILPMPRHPTLQILFPQIQFERVQGHGARHVDPPPRVSARVAALVDPPIPVLGAARAGEMLHQQTRVHGDEDTRAEPRQQAQDLAGPVRVLERRFLGEGSRAGLADGGDDAGGGVEDKEAVRERDEHRRRDGGKGGEEEGEAGVQGRGEDGEGLQDGGVRGHDDGRKGRKVGGGRWRRGGVRGGSGRLIVGKDLVDAEDDVGEQERGLDRVTLAGADAPRGEEDGARDGDADEGGIDVGDGGKVGDAPQEVDGRRDDRRTEHEEADLCHNH